MDSFKYYINDFGFRGANQPLINSDNLIGFFGCSFTFGVGVPEEKHFSKLVCDKLNLTPINFGVPGGSASLVSRIFSTITRFQKLKYAIVMLPNNSRIEYPIEQKDKSTIMTNLLVSFKHYKEEEEALRERLSNVLSHRYMAYTTARSINTIELAAKLAGIHVFYTSWDIPVYNLITSYFKDDKEKIAPWFKFIEKDNYSTYKKGRDGRHPGDYSNKVFADRLCVFLDNKLKINKSLEK